MLRVLQTAFKSGARRLDDTDTMVLTALTQFGCKVGHGSSHVSGKGECANDDSDDAHWVVNSRIPEDMEGEGLTVTDDYIQIAAQKEIKKGL